MLSTELPRSYLYLFVKLYIHLNQSIESAKEMSSRYDSRRFHRSPKVSTPSYQTLPINSNVTPRQLMSPTARNRSDSYDDGYHEVNNQNYQPLINSMLQRMSVLQNSIKQEKSERLEDMTKLLKMIKEMECKHTSIIYDSEIKYNKSTFIPHFIDVVQNKKEDAKSIKKVSSYVFEKNLSQVRVDNNSSSHKNLRKSQVQGSKITQASQKQSRKSVFISQNPQKPKQTPKKTTPTATNPQQTNPQPQPHPQNMPTHQLSQLITQKIQSMRQQIVTKINHKIIEIRQEIKQTQSKLYSQIVSISSNPNKCYQHMFSMHKQHVTDVVAALAKDLEEVRTGNLGGCGGHVGVQIERIQYKMQQMFEIFNDFSNPLKQRIQSMQNQQKQQKIDLDYLHNTIVVLPQTIYTKIQALGQHQEQERQNIEQKIKKLQRSVDKIERIESEQREQVQQLNNIKLLTENDYSNLIKRLNQIENYFTLKLEANQRYIINIQDSSQKLRQEFQQDRIKKTHQVSQAERKREQIYREVQAKLQDKFDQLKISTLKQMHSINCRTQGNLVKVIEKHISFIQEYLKNIEQKHNFLALKYFSAEESQEKQSIQIYRNPFSKLASLTKSGSQQYNLCQDDHQVQMGSNLRVDAYIK